MKRVGKETPIEMKRLLLSVLLCTSLIAYSQPKDEEITILEKLFSGKPDTDNKIVQEKEGSRRELVQVGNDKEGDFKKYQLTEFNSKEEMTASLNIVSKKGIEPGYDLFNLTTGAGKVINFDKLDASTGNLSDKGSHHGKITVKWEGNQFDASEPFSKLAIKCEEGTETCIDHWWVSYVEETGEIISVEHLGTSCYPCKTGTGGGGSSDPNSAPCDPSAVYPEELEFNNYIQMYNTAASVDAPPTSGEQDDPIVGSFVWTVAEGAIASWRVEAVTSYSYKHDKFYNSNLNAFEHIYNIFSLRTSEPYYIGSNTLITSTYTHTSTNDYIFKNNTANAHGKIQINGRIRHVYNIAIRIPFCEPLKLDITEDVANFLTFFPK